MLPSDYRGGSLSPRPFDAIRSVEFSRENILTSASFKVSPGPADPILPTLPLLQKALDHLIEMILQEGQP